MSFNAPKLANVRKSIFSRACFSRADELVTQLYCSSTSCGSWPSRRLSRLEGMLGAQLCSESLALLAAAEECLAANNPLTVELIEHVLLSPDLVPHILGLLESEDGAAAAVCSQWSAGWKATNELRRTLKHVPLDFPGFPAEEHRGDSLQMIRTPDGRLVASTGSKVRILDRSMRVLQTVPGEYGGVIAADDDSIFYRSYREHEQGMCNFSLYRVSHEGRVAAEYQLEGYRFDSPVLAPGGLLFCVIWDAREVEPSEIIAVDAQTLQLRHRFGLGLVDYAQGDQLTVVGDELYVCDWGNHRLQVFSLTGVHRRSVVGEWRSPRFLCCVKDRLYLVEDHPSLTMEDDYVMDDYPLQAHRLLVLSLQGDILQVVTNPREPTAWFGSICCFDGKLLASYRYKYRNPTAGDHWTWKYGMLALKGM